MNAARFDTVPAEARPFHGQPAGLVTRLLANGIDALLVTALAIGAYGAYCIVRFLRQGASFTFPTVSYAVAYWSWFALLVAYFTWCWATTGRTYGDHVLGLRVRRRADGGPVHVARAFVRAILCAGLPLLLVWVAIDRRRRSVQDLLVGTRVVYDWGGSPARSHDAIGVGVDVAPAVADEADDRDAEAVAGLDRE